MVYTQVVPSIGEDPRHTFFEIMLTYMIGKQTQSRGNIVVSSSHVSQSVFEDKLCDKRKNTVVECAILRIKQNLYSTLRN